MTATVLLGFKVVKCTNKTKLPKFSNSLQLGVCVCVFLCFFCSLFCCFHLNAEAFAKSNVLAHWNECVSQDNSLNFAPICIIRFSSSCPSNLMALPWVVYNRSKPDFWTLASTVFTHHINIYIHIYACNIISGYSPRSCIYLINTLLMWHQ